MGRAVLAVLLAACLLASGAAADDWVVESASRRVRGVAWVPAWPAAGRTLTGAAATAADQPQKCLGKGDRHHQRQEQRQGRAERVRGVLSSSPGGAHGALQGGVAVLLLQPNRARGCCARARPPGPAGRRSRASAPTQVLINKERQDARPLEAPPAGAPAGVACYAITLKSPVKKGGTVEFDAVATITGVFSPNPSSMTQTDKQYVEYIDNQFLVSPYTVQKQSTTVSSLTTGQAAAVAAGRSGGCAGGWQQRQQGGQRSGELAAWPQHGGLLRAGRSWAAQQLASGCGRSCSRSSSRAMAPSSAAAPTCSSSARQEQWRISDMPATQHAHAMHACP